MTPEKTDEKTDETLDMVVPEEATLGQIFLLLQRISTKQSLTQQEQVRINRRLETLEGNTADMVATWNASGAILRIVRWTALVGGAALGAWKFFKGSA